MRVIFAIPALNGTVHTQTVLSLISATQLLTLKGISHDVFTISSCPYLPMARNTLAAMFLEDADATELFFIDSDIGFDPDAVVKILERPEGVVAGIYPLKREMLGWPVKIRTNEAGVPYGRDGLIEAELLPTGFMRIKRGVLEMLRESYPDVRYEDNVVQHIGEARNLKEVYDFFGMGVYAHRFTTEDYAFCQRWRDIGGTIWVYPDINFEHLGLKSYAANYHEYLLQMPGGAKAKWQLDSAMNIEGWMALPELAWLAEQASNHRRIVELGCYLGRSTRAMADQTKGVIFAVDDWYGPRNVPLSVKKRGGLYAVFCENLHPHIESGRVVVYKVNHATISEVSALMFSGPETCPDMVFIDGDHSYEAVSRDIATWNERLAPGGLLCGHDGDFPDVRKAVDELLPDAQQAPNTRIWYWEKPEKEQTDGGIPEDDGQEIGVEHRAQATSA